MNDTQNGRGLKSGKSGFGRWTSALLALTLCGSLSIRAQAAHGGQDTSTIFQDTFETDVNGWMVIGPHGHIGTTNEIGKFKNGKSALAFNYRFDVVATNPGEIPIDAIIRPVMQGQLTKALSISFWARSDTSAPFAISLAEKDGGRYLAMVWLPKNQWQHVVLTSADFALTDGKDDPKDPDGKLDMDQVDSVSILNLWEFLSVSAKDNPAISAFFPPQTGEHTLWLDDFTASSAPPTYETPEPTLPVEKRGLWLDSLRRDTLSWLPMGMVEMQLDKMAPTKARALRLDYTQEKGKLTAAVHDLKNVDLSKYDHLEFDVATSKPSKLLLTLEEKNGARYVAIIDVAGNSMPSRKALYFSNFKLADDSPKDLDDKLDLDQLKNLSVVDLTAFFNMQTQPNTLWIGPIRASQEK